MTLTPFPIPGVTPGNWGQQLIDAILERMRDYYMTPEEFGAQSIPGDVVDDTVALQAMMDAAHADPTRRACFVGGRYGWTGDLFHRGGVTVWGTGGPRLLFPSASGHDQDPGLIALDATSRYRYGQWGGTSANDNPGPLMNLNIDGNGVGGAVGELFRAEAANTSVVDVHVRNSVADGVNIASSQNVIFDRLNSGGHLSGTAFVVRNAVAGQQGPGGNKIINSHLGDSNKCVLVDSLDTANFWPHDNIFENCLFETGRTEGQPIFANIHLRAGETQFRACVITTGANVASITSDSSILVENPVYTSISTVATFDSCYLGGGAGAIKARHAIRVKGINEVRLYGRTSVANTTFIVGLDGGAPIVTITGPVTFTTAGIDWYEAINAGAYTNVLQYSRTPIRFLGNALMPNPLQFRRDTDANNRATISRDGQISWFDGASGAVRASLRYDASGQLFFSGRVRQEQGAVTAATTSFIAADQALTIDSAARRAWNIVFQGTNTDITALTISNPVEGAELRIGVLGGAGANTIGWPADMRFASAAPAPTQGSWFFLHFTRLSNMWVESAARVTAVAAT